MFEGQDSDVCTRAISRNISPHAAPAGAVEETASTGAADLPSVGAPDVCVVVPVHNGGAAFGACLESLKLLDPAPHEIIVVADHDADGSGALAENAGFTVVRLPQRSGPARARNIGAKRTSCGIVFFVDADVSVKRDAIAAVGTAFERFSDVDAIFGSYDDEPGELNFLSQYRNLFHHYVHQASREEAWTFWGACGAVRRQAFLAAGGFDEGYGDPSIEDIEFGYRMRSAGHKIRLIKTLQVKHLKRWTVGSLLRADFFLRALPWTRLILERKQSADDLNLKNSSRASVALAGIAALSLAGALMLPWLLAVAGAAAILLLMLNAPLYRFFYRKRGLRFTLAAIGWHWFYYLYGGVAFGIGVAEYALGRRTGGGRPEAHIETAGSRGES